LFSPVNSKTDAKKCDRITIGAILWLEDDENRAGLLLICAAGMFARLTESASKPPRLSTLGGPTPKAIKRRLRRDCGPNHGGDQDCVRPPYLQLGDLQTAPGSDLQSLFETAHQVICSEWLSEQADCATGGSSRFQPRLATRSNHDDWHSPVTSHEQSLEIKSAHAGHINVGDDTVTRAFPARREKLFRGCKPARAVSQRTERLDKRCSERFVIVDDRD
jgi:hypothetical protein